MADKMPNIKNLLLRTGLRATEFAALAGVTPPMAYRWLKGAEAHILRLPKLHKLEAALLEIAKTKKLPLSVDVLSKHRLGTIKVLLLNHLKKSG